MSQQDRDKAAELASITIGKLAPDRYRVLVAGIATALEQRGAEERERCAKIAESHIVFSSADAHRAANAIATAIRETGASDVNS